MSRLVDRFNRAIGSIPGVVFGVLTTLGSVPLVVLGIDHNGFDTLYYMTAISYLTQFTLTLAALNLARDGQKHELWIEQTLRNSADTMAFLLAAAREQGAELEEIHDDVERVAAHLPHDEVLARTHRQEEVNDDPS